MLQQEPSDEPKVEARKGRFLDSGGHRVKQSEHLTLCTSGKFTLGGSKKKLNILNNQGYNQ
jgi:hypothetical protein